jgi:hypothetical protein
MLGAELQQGKTKKHEAACARPLNFFEEAE